VVFLCESTNTRRACKTKNRTGSRITQAAKIKNATQLDETAHKLKGTFRYLAAEQAQQAAYELELAGKENKLENLDEKLDFLEKKGIEVIDYIKNFDNQFRQKIEI